MRYDMRPGTYCRYDNEVDNEVLKIGSKYLQ